MTLRLTGAKLMFTKIDIFSKKSHIRISLSTAVMVIDALDGSLGPVMARGCSPRRMITYHTLYFMQEINRVNTWVDQRP